MVTRIVLELSEHRNVYVSFTNHPGPCVCKYDTNIGHTCRGLGCSIFVEINIKRPMAPQSV